MKKVLKYQLPEVVTKIQLPAGSKFVHVAIQNDVPTVWAETPNDFAGYEERTIETFGTGHLIPADAVYLATLLMMNDALVLHFYEVLQ